MIVSVNHTNFEQ